jgi:S-formylglutathione hydrolase FrmB
MGGYSAFKSPLRCPEKYIAAASLSGVLDII